MLADGATAVSGRASRARSSRAGQGRSARVRKSRCGTVSLRLRHRPPDHSTMSRSIGRAPQRRPRRRPNARSIAFRRASRTGGASSLSISAAALAKRRIEGPSGGVAITGDTATTPPIARERRRDRARAGCRGGRDGWRRARSRRLSSPSPAPSARGMVFRTLSAARTPSRRATARSARASSRFATSCAASTPIGGTRRCPPGAIRRPGSPSSGSRRASTARTARGGRSRAISRANCSTTRSRKFGLATGTYGATPDDGLRLDGAIIVNGVRCLPPANKPTPEEIRTCRPFLEAPLAALGNARVLIALGQIAHDTTLRTLGVRAAQGEVRASCRACTARRTRADR